MGLKRRFALVPKGSLLKVKRLPVEFGIFDGDPIARLPLTRGLFTIIDLSDYEDVSRWNWYASKDGYVHRRADGHDIALHRYLLGLTEPTDLRRVDHRNLQALDNRRKNLRIATVAQNAMNRKVSSRSSSGIKCVWWDSKRAKWQAYIGFNGKKIAIGRFSTTEEAVEARRVAALKLHGDFARIN